MILTDEDALICDFAETYHIYDYKALPLPMAAVLCFGLREDSRIMKELSGSSLCTSEMLLASIFDQLAFQSWTKTKDAQKGRNRPKSVLDALLGKNKKDNNVVSFSTPEEWEAMRNELLGR